MTVKPSLFFACLIALLILPSCRSASQSATSSISATSDRSDVTNNSRDIQVKPIFAPQPTIVPVAIQADVKSPVKLTIPIAVKTDAPESVQVQVALKLTNSPSEQIVLPIRFQFDTNVPSLRVAAPFSGTITASQGLTSPPFKLQWGGNESFWLMLLVIVIVLVWFIGKLDKANDVPQRALPAACAIVATIHFYNSSGRADWILIVVLALGAAPWLSKYIESISQKGIVFAKQGSVPGPAKPPASQHKNPPPPPGSPPPPPSSPQPPTPEGAPPIAGAAQPQSSSTFDSLSYHEKKILATLWKYQHQQFGDKREPRWTFIVLNEKPSNMAFSLGCLLLFGKNLADTAPNGQVLLTDRGFEFCKSNAAQIAEWSDTYDNFSA